jgi:hypothetical protein
MDGDSAKGGCVTDWQRTAAEEIDRLYRKLAPYGQIWFPPIDEIVAILRRVEGEHYQRHTES